jgi:hypothetical protein
MGTRQLCYHQVQIQLLLSRATQLFHQATGQSVRYEKAFELQNGRIPSSSGLHRTESQLCILLSTFRVLGTSSNCATSARKSWTNCTAKLWVKWLRNVASAKKQNMRRSLFLPPICWAIGNWPGTFFLKYWRTQDQVGSLTRIALSWAQYQVGIDKPILEDYGSVLVGFSQTASWRHWWQDLGWQHFCSTTTTGTWLLHHGFGTMIRHLQTFANWPNQLLQTISPIHNCLRPNPCQRHSSWPSHEDQTSKSNLQHDNPSPNQPSPP